MRAWRMWLRTVRGQLTLFGVTFAAAIVLAVVIVCLRDVLFERYVRETYPPAGAWASEAARDLSAPSTPPQRVESIGVEAVEKERSARQNGKPVQDLEELYGFWLLNPESDPDNLLPVRLTRHVPDWVIARLKRTLAAGNSDQFARARRWLRAIADLDETRDRVQQLEAYADRRAARMTH